MANNGRKWGKIRLHTTFGHPTLAGAARSAEKATGGWTPGGFLALLGPTGGVGGPKCPQASQKTGKKRGYPFLTVFDNFLVHFGWV